MLQASCCVTATDPALKAVRGVRPNTGVYWCVIHVTLLPRRTAAAMSDDIPTPSRESRGTILLSLLAYTTDALLYLAVQSTWQAFVSYIKGSETLGILKLTKKVTPISGR